MLCGRIKIIENITGIRQDYRKARIFSLYYLNNMLEKQTSTVKQYLILRMNARVMGLSVGTIKLQIEKKSGIKLEDYIKNLDKEIVDNVIKLREFVGKTIMKLNYDTM